MRGHIKVCEGLLKPLSLFILQRMKKKYVDIKFSVHNACLE